MSAPKFTRWPWVSEARKTSSAYADINGAIGFPEEHTGLAKVVVKLDGERYEQGIANAHLIAAAPDMFEALEALVML